MRISLPLNWRRIPHRYRLEGTKCENCGTYYFPPRAICPKCRRAGKIVPAKFKGVGKVISYTKVFVAPPGLEEQVPYYMAIIELEEGTRLTAQIVNVRDEEMKIGLPVKVMFRKLQQEDPEGLIHYGFKFEPVRE